jgi:phosphotransferase system IIB component
MEFPLYLLMKSLLSLNLTAVGNKNNIKYVINCVPENRKTPKKVKILGIQQCFDGSCSWHYK